MKRVCMRVNNVYTSDLRVRRAAEALDESGFDVTVVADLRDAIPERGSQDGVTVRRIGKTSRVPYWSIVRPLLEERADVYHAHDVDSLLPCLAAARLGHRGARVIYDSHELWSGAAPDKMHARRRMLVRIEGPMLRASHGLIAASPAYLEEIVEMYRFAGPAQTVLNVPAFRTDAELAPAWARRERPGGPVRITAVSVFQHGRGAIPLIRALQHLPDDHLVELVGPIPQRDYAAMMRKEAGPFGDRVVFAGPVPPDQVVPRLAASHASAVLIEPISKSYELTSPNKLYESMMAGTPIVASDGRVIADVVRKTGAGVICDVADPKDIARAVLEATARSREFGAAGRAAADRYNWGIEKERLLSFYASVLGS